MKKLPFGNVSLKTINMSQESSCRVLLLYLNLGNNETLRGLDIWNQRNSNKIVMIWKETGGSPSILTDDMECNNRESKCILMILNELGQHQLQYSDNKECNNRESIYILMILNELGDHQMI